MPRLIELVQWLREAELGDPRANVRALGRRQHRALRVPRGLALQMTRTHSLANRGAAAAATCLGLWD